MRGLAAVAILALTCCTGRELHLRDAEAIARSAGLTPYLFQAHGLSVLGFEAAGPKNGILTVYIEGDGRAWSNPWHASTDPTPTDPIGLKLAAADPSRPLLYLARPCQYEVATGCDNRLWTQARLSADVVDAFQQLLDDGLRRSSSNQLALIGYSGGGALATLLAERRRDVAWLVTVAANLDLAEWTRTERVEPLSESIDPAGEAAAIGQLPQVHFVGGRDDVVPPTVVQSFIRHLPSRAPVRVVMVPDYDHVCCWAETWPQQRARIEFLQSTSAR
jgi:pimeloyl-ACP methyl ester carboxylesterase